jgi:hypothetical protein
MAKKFARPARLIKSHVLWSSALNVQLISSEHDGLHTFINTGKAYVLRGEESTFGAWM